jgi:hypothetical protein
MFVSRETVRAIHHRVERLMASCDDCIHCVLLGPELCGT